jgi:transposase-like protein
MPARKPARFTNADAARKYLETIYWPDGAVCARCGVIGKATRLKGKSTRPGVHWCNACEKPFTVTVGTIFENTKVPLNSWLYLNHLLCCSEKRISVHRLAQMLGVTYKTAWFMVRHVRDAMASAAPGRPSVKAKGRAVRAALLAVSETTP